jgi:hypothetical protein
MRYPMILAATAPGAMRKRMEDPMGDEPGMEVEDFNREWTRILMRSAPLLDLPFFDFSSLASIRVHSRLTL